MPPELQNFPSPDRQKARPRGRQELHLQAVRAAGHQSGQEGGEEDAVPALHLRHRHQQHPQGLQRRQGHGAAQVPQRLWGYLTFSGEKKEKTQL